MKAAVEAEEKETFWKEIEESKDLEDNLQGLTEFLQKNTKATGVYIGRLVYPSRKIADDDDDKAHLDSELPKVIKYINASKNHEFMVDAVLPPEEGITHDVFKEGDDGEDAAAGSENEEGEAKESTPTDSILKSYKGVVYVPEVIREKRMSFQKVPKLGAFMAVPLVYNSCLTDEALEAAVENYKEISDSREEQNKQRVEYDEQLETKRAAAQAAGEPLDEEEKVWDVLEYAPFKTHEEKYVVCLDTMGQDRQFTDEEKTFALTTIRKFKEAWEKEERDNLTADRDRKLGIMGEDKEVVDKADEEANQAI